MTISIGHARLEADPRRIASDYDREPFAYSHNLPSLDLFAMDRIAALAQQYSPHPTEYFVSAAAPSAATEFNAVPHSQCNAWEAMDRLEGEPIRILLKRPENRDPQFRTLLNTLFEQIVSMRPTLRDEKIVRLESAIFITSAQTITPCHFDPEIAFFSQVAGEKSYHVYSPGSMTEQELEDFYLRGMVSICEVDLPSRDPKREYTFTLTPGLGLHQPQNSPHWVRTGADRSVSYTFVFETNMSRARNRARAFNHYVRLAGMRPRSPGHSPALDLVKASAMRVVLPLRRRTQNWLRN